MLKIAFLVLLLVGIHSLHAPWWLYVVALGASLEFTVGGKRVL